MTPIILASALLALSFGACIATACLIRKAQSIQLNSADPNEKHHALAPELKADVQATADTLAQLAPKATEPPVDSLAKARLVVDGLRGMQGRFDERFAYEVKTVYLVAHNDIHNLDLLTHETKRNSPLADDEYDDEGLEDLVRARAWQIANQNA